MIARLLFWLSGYLPVRIIDQHGEPYMERYSVWKTTRITIYLHRFVGRDGDRQTHDHPWTCSFSLILAGGYSEQRVAWLDPEHGPIYRFSWLWPGHLNVIRGRDFHRISETLPETWTLFVHFQRVKGWGYLHGPQTPEGNGLTIYVGAHDPEGGTSWQRIAPRGRDSTREEFGSRVQRGSGWAVAKGGAGEHAPRSDRGGRMKPRRKNDDDERRIYVRSGHLPLDAPRRDRSPADR